jgi:3-oxoacyl-[acyl-carrier protein] reductase
VEINLFSAVRFTRGVAPHMRKQGGGRIINISTVGAHTPPQIMPDYDSAKAAMLAFSKATSFELAADNILVCPALIRTPLWEAAADTMVPALGKNREDVLQNLANQFLALKRFGRVEEVSGLVAFLASERASFYDWQSVRRRRRFPQVDLAVSMPARISSALGPRDRCG